MDEIIQRLRSARQPMYVDAVIVFDKQWISIAADPQRIQQCLKRLQRVKKFTYSTCTEYTHTELYQKQIDMQVTCIQNCHYFCFSHHVMDGYSFMLFCLNFYTLLGFPRPRDSPPYPTGKKNHGVRHSTFEKTCAMLQFFAAPLFRYRPGPDLYLFPGNAGGISFRFFSISMIPSGHRAGLTLNQFMCKIIAEACRACKLQTANGRDVSFGVPVFIVEPSRKLRLGNHMAVVYDDWRLSNSKNEIILAVLCVALKICCWVSVPLQFLRWVFRLGLNHVDVIYSNMDGRRVSNSPGLKSIAYMCPTFHETLLSFSMITVQGKINVACKSLRLPQDMLDAFCLYLQQRISSTVKHKSHIN